MNPTWTDQELDARLTAVLDELSRETLEAPSTAEMAIRVSLGQRARRSRARGWNLVLAATVVTSLLVAGALVGGFFAERVPPPTLVPPPSAAVSSEPSVPATMNGCDLEAVVTRPMGGTPPGPVLEGSGVRMYNGNASWLQPLAGSTAGLVVFQGSGARLPVALAEVDRPNGLPNVSRVTTIAPDRSHVVLALANSSVDRDHVCGDLYVVASDGSAITRIFHGGPGLVGVPLGFSPDSALLAFVATDVRDTKPTSTLHVVDLSGDDVIDPVSHDCRELRASWAPAGRRLAVACSGGQDPLVVLDVDGGQQTHPRPGSAIAAIGWAADGASVLVATVDAVGTAGLAIHRLDPATEAPTVVTANFGGVELEWLTPNPWVFSPSGRHLMAIAGPPPGTPASQRSDKIYLIDVDGGQVVPIDAAVPQRARKGQFSSRDLGWTVDGSQVVVRVAGDDGLFSLLRGAPDWFRSFEAGVVDPMATWVVDAPP